MDLDIRIDKIENRLDNLEDKFNIAIPDIQSGIKEIKVMLQERPIQEELKNSLLEKEIQALELKEEQKINALEDRVKKVEDNQTWLKKTTGAAIIGVLIEVVLFVIKMM